MPGKYRVLWFFAVPKNLTVAEKRSLLSLSRHLMARYKIFVGRRLYLIYKDGWVIIEHNYIGKELN